MHVRRSLHLVGRWEPARSIPLARELLETGFEEAKGVSRRVVELFDPAAGMPVVDVALGERDMPEVMSLLHWADEVHTHAVSLEVALRRLPYVLPEALVDKPLVVHGPWPQTEPAARVEGARLEQWPGPVMYDAAALAFLGRSGDAPDRAWIDPTAAELLPRACGPQPLVLEDGRLLAVVGLAAALPSALRTELRLGLSSLACGPLVLEAIDEEEGTSLEARTGLRRAMQAMIVPGAEERGSWPRVLLETVAQGIPAIVVGGVAERFPRGVIPLRESEPHALAERCLACIRSFTREWALGQAAPVDVAAARTWLCERVAFPERLPVATGTR